ncbi:MAG: ABC transporter ATP-binding protein [Phycisphaerales bacterium]|jgi:oligopeptide/dipeptide ABC transporter ATP-binding protein
MQEKPEYILRVNDLRTYFRVDGQDLPAVDGVTFDIKRNSTLALVGESGCGKSVTAYSLLRLIQKPGRIAGGRIEFFGADSKTIDVTALNEKSEQLYTLRGGLIGMIFQEPMSALSPVHTIGSQICETILLHKETDKEQTKQKALEMLKKVGIPGPERIFQQYPHEISGGMRQRAVIAMALASEPQLLIADEPTTALDVTIQAQILNLIKKLQQQMGLSVLLITHDIGVVAQIAQEVAIMYLGRIVEHGPIHELIKSPLHPYTMALLQSLPSLSHRKQRLKYIEGSVPSLYEVPAGCPFHPRCSYAESGKCDRGRPPELRELTPQHEVACVKAEEIKRT